MQFFRSSGSGRPTLSEGLEGFTGIILFHPLTDIVGKEEISAFSSQFVVNTKEIENRMKWI